MKTEKKVGLVLGSGSSRGWAHIGAIEALTEEGIPIDYIAGCSIGSYVGAIYASGNLESLKNFVLKMDGKKVFSYFDVVFPRSGFLNGTKKVKELFSMHTSAKTFADLNIPVKMVATNLDNGDKIVISTGGLIHALRATMSIPALFPPAKFKNLWLVDGGLVDPVPVGVARGMGADIVIAINLNSGLSSRRQDKEKTDHTKRFTSHFSISSSELMKKLSENYRNIGINLKDKFSGIFDTDTAAPHILESVSSSIGIMQERIARINLAVEPPDILIEPRLGDLKMMDFDQVEHAIEEGYTRMKNRIEDIKILIEK